jgi:hypothetical protein
LSVCGALIELGSQHWIDKLRMAMLGITLDSSPTKMQSAYETLHRGSYGMFAMYTITSVVVGMAFLLTLVLFVNFTEPVPRTKSK